MRSVLVALTGLAFAAPGVPALTAPGAVTFAARATGRTASVDPAGLAPGVALADGSVILYGADHGVLLARLRPDGALDRAFGTGGIARVPVSAPSPAYVGFADPDPVALLRRPDGRLVFVGAQRNTGTFAGATVLVGLTAAGGLDPSFAGGRPLVIPTEAKAATLAPDGAVIESGYVLGPRPSVGGSDTLSSAVQRVTPDGALDGNFGDNGRTSFADSAVALLARPDGSTLVAVARNGGAPATGATLRLLTQSGALDPSFAVDEPQGFYVSQLLPTPGGALWAGPVPLAGDPAPATHVVRVTDAGTLDPAFGDVTVRAGTFPGVAPAPDGGAVVAGLSTYETAPGKTATERVARINAHGATTATVTPLPFGGGYGTFYAIRRLPAVGSFTQSGFRGGSGGVVRPDGSLLIAGAVAAIQYTGEGEGYLAQEVAAAAIRPDGGLDTTFGGPVVAPTVRITLDRQRAATAGDPRRRFIRLTARVPGPGLMRITATAHGRPIARSDAVLVAGGPHAVIALLTAKGRRVLRHAGRTPVAVTATYRDFVGATATARAHSTLR